IHQAADHPGIRLEFTAIDSVIPRTSHDRNVFTFQLPFNEEASGQRIAGDVELAQESLVDSQHSIAPGVEVKQNILSGFKSRHPKDHRPAFACLTAQLLEHDFSLGDFAFEDAAHLETDVCIDKVSMRIDAGRNTDDTSGDDRARLYNHLVVPWHDGGRCERSLRTSYHQKKSHQRENVRSSFEHLHSRLLFVLRRNQLPGSRQKSTRGWSL